MAFSYVVTTVAFALIYKIMPRVKVRWHDVWLGAAVTALLFTIGRFLIGLYIGKSGIASGYGAAGSLVIVFIWVYYSAQIFLLGAEFTWVYAQTFGSMRGIAQSTPPDDAGEPPIPARSEDSPTDDAGPVIAFAPPPVARPMWMNLGAGVAFLLTLNYLAARLFDRR